MVNVKSKKRILTLDLIRGYFILVIIIDHLQRWPGMFDWITGQGRLWVSAAEGFILMSGVMIGLIRGRKEISLPLKTVTKKIFKRAFTLYLWAIITAVVSLYIIKYTGLTFVPFPPGIDSFGPFVNDYVEIATLTATFGWSIFLQFYVVFLLFSPLAIWLLRKNMWPILLALSTLVWAVGIQYTSIFSSWQLLFFIGVVGGFYYDSIVAWWAKFPHRKAAKISIFTIAGLSIAASVTTLFGWAAVKSGNAPVSYEQFLAFRSWIDPYFVREKLLPMHLFLALIWFAALYFIVKRYETKINKYFGWLLVPFGQNSLFVYIVQGFVVIAISGLIPQNTNMFINAVIILGTILTIWAITFVKPLYKIIPR